jgi:Uma2 family endonuclease
MKILAKWTVADYHRLIESGLFPQRRLELIAGEIIEIPPEGPFHAFVTQGFSQYLQTLLQGLALVREAHPITLADSEPEPDLAIARLPRETYKTRHPYAEDIFWLIEISQSSLDYDLTEKKQAYAQANILEYWVGDINTKQVYVFRHPRGEDYQFSSIVKVGSLTPLAFPDIQIAVQSFWS